MMIKAYFPPILKDLVQAVMTSAGKTSTQLRSSVRIFVELLTEGKNPTMTSSDMKISLRDYLRKVALYAHRVEDSDMKALKADGYSEDEIFEATVTAAVTAGVYRFESGMKALKAKQ